MSRDVVVSRQHERSRAEWDDLASVLLVRGGDPFLHLLLQRVHARLEPSGAITRRVELLFEAQDALHTHQRDALVGELLNAAQELDVVVGVAAAPTARASRSEQAL